MANLYRGILIYTFVFHDFGQCDSISWIWLIGWPGKTKLLDIPGQTLDRQPHQDTTIEREVLLAKPPTSLFEVVHLFLPSWEGKLSPSRTLNGAVTLFSLFLITLLFFQECNCVFCGLACFAFMPPWLCFRVFALLFLCPWDIHRLNTQEHNYFLFTLQISAQLLLSQGTLPQPSD